MKLKTLVPSLDEWQVLLNNASVQDLLAESVGGTGKSGFNVVFAGMSGSSGIELFEEAAAFATVDDRDENYKAGPTKARLCVCKFLQFVVA